ncbi:exostosin-like 2 [Engraulis encrasicolus]|uniref:exostosin-like 2 n=1 Tax=Engraulis encrasicolus TaxID=184585 RepID=UPI002FCEF0BB
MTGVSIILYNPLYIGPHWFKGFEKWLSPQDRMPSKKLKFSSLLVLVVVAICFYAWMDDLINPGSVPHALQRFKSSNKANESFTMIMPTFDRTELLFDLLKHYQAVPYLKQIIIVWQNIGQKPPLELWESLGPHLVPILFKEQTQNLLRNRFLPFPEIDTEAVLTLDDDLQISIPDINFAFSVWTQFQDQLVGFVARTHTAHAKGVYTVSTPKTDRYSLALTGASFFHRRYLKLYHDQDSRLHILVDSIKNCEDIAMNCVVSFWLLQRYGPDAPPAAVHVKPVDMKWLEMKTKRAKKGRGNIGLSRRPGFVQQRGYCLTEFVKIWNGTMPLHYNNITLTLTGKKQPQVKMPNAKKGRK